MPTIAKLRGRGLPSVCGPDDGAALVAAPSFGAAFFRPPLARFAVGFLGTAFRLFAMVAGSLPFLPGLNLIRAMLPVNKPPGHLLWRLTATRCDPRRFCLATGKFLVDHLGVFRDRTMHFRVVTAALRVTIHPRIRSLRTSTDEPLFLLHNARRHPSLTVAFLSSGLHFQRMIWNLSCWRPLGRRRKDGMQNRR